MIPPDAARHDGALGIRRVGLADVRKREHTVAAVKPAVRTPRERIQRLMRVLVTPAIAQNLRRTGRLRLRALLHRDERQVWRRARPYAAESKVPPAHGMQALQDNRAIGELGGAARVLE